MLTKFGRYPITLWCLLFLLLIIASVKWLSPSSNFQSPILHRISPPNSMGSNKEIEFDFSPFLIQYKSGHVERIVRDEFVAAGTDPKIGVTSKDIIINPNTNLLARIFLPNILEGNSSFLKKLPVVVYYHGGAFVIESAFSPTYHNYLNSVTEKAGVVAVSIEYRRAPEHTLPTAYDDSFVALKWVASHAEGGSGSEPWLLQYGDFQRVFLAGDSAGANIAHNILLRTKNNALGNGFKIQGMTLLNPYFWGKDPLGSETTNAKVRENYEKTWGFVCGWKYGLDSPWVDPISTGFEEFKDLSLTRVRVSVSELDDFRERGKAYCKSLKASGWNGDVELFETLGEGHVYFLSKPHSEKARVELEDLVAFINR